MKRVLFVCMGNICRSPTAEAVLKNLVREQGLEHDIEADSAGTIGHHRGEPADDRMRRHAARRSYTLTSIARQIETQDFHRFDWIVAMDRENLAGIRAMAPPAADPDPDVAEVRLFSDFLPDGWPKDVPDPYYGGDEGFETVLDMIEAGSQAIVDELIS